MQVKSVKVTRDYNRDSALDFNNGTLQKGMFGINIHRAESMSNTKIINKFSAGCQVFQNAADFSEFISLCQRHSQRHKNLFTYTLIDFRSLKKATIRRAVAIASIFSIISLWWTNRPKHENS